MPWHFRGLELAFFACFVLTLRDVRVRWRAGERYAAFQWLVVLTYGVAMELLAFNAYPDYEHGQFTVQLYGGKLPLYVTFVYVVFHYTGLKLVERWRMGRLAEAVSAGLAIVLLDVPFDVLGVDARWWVWHPSSRDVAQRWLGVPLTSYEWYLLFGAILVGACSVLRPRIERRPFAVQAALAPLVAVGVIVLGIVGFLPFHALEALGMPDGAVVAAHALTCVVVVLRARRGVRGEPVLLPRGLAAIPALLAAWYAMVLVGLAARGEVAQVPAKSAVIALSVAAMLLVFVRERAHVRGRSASPPRSPAPAGSRTSS